MQRPVLINFVSCREIMIKSPTSGLLASVCSSFQKLEATGKGVSFSVRVNGFYKDSSLNQQNEDVFCKAMESVTTVLLWHSLASVRPPTEPKPNRQNRSVASEQLARSPPKFS